MMNTKRMNPLHACAALLLASLAGAAGAQEAAASAPAAGEPAVIRFQRSAAYLDETAVADNIRKECSSLGTQLSASTERYAQEFGLKVERVEKAGERGDAVEFAGLAVDEDRHRTIFSYL